MKKKLKLTEISKKGLINIKGGDGVLYPGPGDKWCNCACYYENCEGASHQNNGYANAEHGWVSKPGYPCN